MTPELTPAEAERQFLGKLRDFCRAHRTGRRVDPALAQAAADWEELLDERLRTPVLLVAEEQHASDPATPEPRKESGS